MDEEDEEEEKALEEKEAGQKDAEKDGTDSDKEVVQSNAESDKGGSELDGEVNKEDDGADKEPGVNSDVGNSGDGANTADVQPDSEVNAGPSSGTTAPTTPKKDKDRKGPQLREGWTNAQCRAALHAFLIVKPCFDLVVEEGNHALFDPEGEANNPTVYPVPHSLRSQC